MLSKVFYIPCILFCIFNWLFIFEIKKPYRKMSPTEVVHTVFYKHQASGVCTIACVRWRGLGQNAGDLVARIRR